MRPLIAVILAVLVDVLYDRAVRTVRIVIKKVKKG
jgi:hypothetical protein